MRLKYYSLHQLATFMLLTLIASNTWALSLMIGEPQINSMLALTFPYQTSIGNSHISLTDPKTHFYEASQEIGIALNISLTNQNSGQTMKAKTLVRGGVHFDNQEQQLQLIKPKIVSLDWAGKPASVHQGLADQVTQLVGRDLPVIILLDIKQLIGKALTLSDIEIKKHGILVSF